MEKSGAIPRARFLLLVAAAFWVFILYFRLSAIIHYRKIWRCRAPLRCRGSTHGIANYAVSRTAQPTANKKLTTNINEAHGKIRTHGII
jgi:hypothetical protein